MQLAVQVPAVQIVPAAQVVPQPPQLTLSVSSFTQTSPQATRPPVQVVWQVPPEQT